jgi:hypothetical protein
VKYDIADDKYKSMIKTLSFLMHDLNLVYDEALTLVKMVYDAAQETLSEERDKDKIKGYSPK